LTRDSARILRAVLVLAASTALIAAASSPPTPATAQTASPLVDLSGSTDLQKQFNSDRGHVRLVLLLSPT
jgi:ABC-type phosphate transport system substrate-binding protein